MTLASPAPISTTSDSTHSDGYFSEVFENMDDVSTYHFCVLFMMLICHSIGEQ